MSAASSWPTNPDPHSPPPGSAAADATSPTVWVGRNSDPLSSAAPNLLQTFERLAEFTGGSFNLHTKDVWDSLLDNLRKTSVYYEVDVAPVNTSLDVIQVHTDHNAYHAASPRFKRLQLTPVIWPLTVDSKAFACSLPLSGVPFVARASCKSAATKIELEIPHGTAVVGQTGHLKLRIGVIPQIPKVKSAETWQVVEANIPPDRLEDPVRHALSINIPEDTTSLCVYIRDEMNGGLGSVTLRF